MQKVSMVLGAFALAFLTYLGAVSVTFAQDLTQEGIAVPDRDSALWSAIIGPWMPVIIATINRQRWTSTAKGVSTFVVSAVAALGTSYFAGELESGEILLNVLIVMSAATVSYNMFWKPSGIAPKIEHATG